MSNSGRGGVFCVSFEDVAVSTVVDLFDVVVPAGKQYVIHEARVSQSTDAGDAEAEQLLFKIKRFWNGQSAGAGGGTSVPEAVHGRSRHAGAPATWGTNNTTQVAGSNSTLLHVTAEDIQVGLNYLPKTEFEPIIVAGETFVISLANAPADAITVSAVVIFEVQSAAAHV